jgi:NAD(P)-dependent dehydrogenase (short-subunit alcohol dehydrogenase family)
MWRENIDEVKALLALDCPEALPNFLATRAIDPTRAYNLSKEAVIVYTKGLTHALLPRDIRVNSVSPAPVATGILDDFMAALGDPAAAALALPGRAGSPEEVAHTILFLASEDSSWVKGHDILVDGGVSAMVTAKELEFEMERA